ncbi:MAG: DUF1016 N-terminal domain-containing protein [Desulfobacterales bacterium]|nr:DUF1016 N-terminal domain-containing protein [Desulfobacterales bacterium]
MTGDPFSKKSIRRIDKARLIKKGSYFMSGKLTKLPNSYPVLLKNIKDRIQNAQVRASFSANHELIFLYWQIGRSIVKRKQKEGWGAGVLPQVARELKKELPEVKGFLQQNIGRMIQFYRVYPLIFSNLPQAVAQFSVPEWANLKQLVVQLPWEHNILLIQKVKDINKRHWYMQQTIQNGWSRNIVALQIDGNAYEQQGKAVKKMTTSCLPRNPTSRNRL